MIDIFVGGDFYLANRLEDSAFQPDGVNRVFGDLRPVIEAADFSVLNLETPLLPTDTPSQSLRKCGPNLRNPLENATLLKKAGFNAVTLANNHFFDQGEYGVDSTLKALKNNGILTVGGGRNLAEAIRPLVVTIRGKKVAFVNFCENEFSIATATSGGSAPLDFIENFRQLTTVAEIADYVIAIVHCGVELFPLPTPEQQRRLRFLAEHGADAVIAHHAHCFCGWEYHGRVPIFYGLGNFSFDNPAYRNSVWNLGVAVKLTFSEQPLQVELIPYLQGDNVPGLQLLSQERQQIFERNMREKTEILADPEQLEQEFNGMCKRSAAMRLEVFETWHHKIFRVLRRYKIFPSTLSVSRRRLLLNYFRCESHREVLLKLLEAPRLKKDKVK